MPFTQTFHGFIENTTDTLLIIEACRSKLLPTINRRLVENERSSIKSGTIFVFDESESGIKRWTDGFLWSPSRILGNFLIYRELANREHRKSVDEYHYSYSSASPRHTPTLENDQLDEESAILLQRGRALVGSLTTSNTSYNFKKNGLIKKTIRILVNGNYKHIVSYYTKYDVLNNLLPTPSASPQLACLQISADLIPHLQGASTTPMSSPPNHQATTASRKRSQSSTSSSASDAVGNNIKYSRPKINNYDQEQPQPRYHHISGYTSSAYSNIPTPSFMRPAAAAAAAISAPITAGQQQQSPTLGYSSYYSAARPSILDNNAAPFTKLPPPSLSQHYPSDFHVLTAARAPRYAVAAVANNNGKRKLVATISDPLLSPSPSPTPSPPTSLGNVRYPHTGYYDATTTPAGSFLDNNIHYNRQTRTPSSALDNY